MTATDPEKRSGACPQCKRRIQFTLDAGRRVVECTHCGAQIKIKSKSKAHKSKTTPAAKPTAQPSEPDADSDRPPLPNIVTDVNQKSVEEMPVIVETATGDQPAKTVSTPAAVRDSDADQPDDSSLAEADDQQPGDSAQVDLLPPKFLVDQYNSPDAILLPSADGGTQIVDTSVIHVRDGNRTVALKTLTPEQRFRQRLIRDIIMFVLAGLMLLAALLIWI